MFKFPSKFPELRILAILGIITLAWHLLIIASSFLFFFADIFLLIILSWLLAFIVEPVVSYLQSRGLNRTASAIIAYLGLAVFAVLLILIAIPTTISQLSQLGNVLPTYVPQNSLLSSRLEEFLSSTISHSVNIASDIASAAAALVLVFFLSFYFLLSRKQISQLILNLIPDDYEDDFRFLETTINSTFASFIRVQFLLGLALGLLTFITLIFLRIDFAVSSSIISAILAMIPVVGPLLFLFPPLLAALVSSPQKLLITGAILILAAQLIYNILAPRLLGKALQIHPIIVLISFFIGYKIAGIWGAIFAVPVTSTLSIIFRDIFKYWQEEADRS